MTYFCFITNDGKEYASDEVEEKDKGGRPKEGIKFGQHKNEFGWDPTGKKELDQAFDTQNQKSAFQPDTTLSNSKNINNIAVENHDILKYLKQKSPKMILESLKNKNKDFNDDNGTILDENNIL